MRKVIHLRSSFEPGGTENLLLHLFNEPQDLFQMHLVLIKDGSLISQLDDRNGNIYYCWFRKRFLDFSVLARIYRLMRREEISVVHTHQLIELLYAVCLKVVFPRLLIVHQIHIMYAKRDWTFYLERFLSQLFAKVFTVSQASRKELASEFGFAENKIGVLYNAVKANGAAALPAAVVEAKLKIPPDPARINIVMVANFVWGKDHETVFAAYDQFIREALPEVSFYFIGKESAISQKLTAEYLNREDLDSGRMVLCGQVPHANTLLPAFDMVVMSCFSETFNMALVEAAVAGKPILASDIPVFLELSEQGKYFNHFKTGDPVDFYRQLKVMVDEFKADAMADHAPHFREKFGYQTLLQNLDAVYSGGNQSTL